MLQETNKIQQFSGDIYNFKGNEPIILNDPEAIWVVESGSLALFAIKVKNGTPEGKRRYLFNVKAGEAMFSTTPALDGELRQILAVSLEETELRRVPKSDFNTQIQQQVIQNLIDRWVHHLGAVLIDIPCPSLSVPDSAIQFLAFAEGEVFQSEHNAVAWVRIQHGHVNWMGTSELSLAASTGIVPLGNNMWIQAIDNVEMERLYTEQIDNPTLISDGLETLQHYFLRCIELLEQEEQQQEIQRFEERERLNRQVMEETLSELSGVLKTRKSVISPDTTPEVTHPHQALLVAAGAVGKALGIKIRPPAKSEDLRRVQDPLDAIARASQLRMRRIQLTDNWWKKDCGPMLTYTRDDERPVALLPVSSTSYEIFDPMLRKRKPINARRARALEDSAYVFYRPLPDKKLNTFDLLQFALYGHFREVVIVLLTGIFVTILGMFAPQATAILIDNAIPDSNRSLLIQIAAVLIAATFGTTLFQVAQGLAIMRLETYADSSTQAAVWDRLLKLKPAFFRQYAIGDLQSRVQGISQIRKQLGTTVLKSIFTSVFSFLNLGLLFYYSPSLAFIALIVAFINIVLTVISGVLTLKKVRPQLELQGEIFGVMVQLINGVTKLRVAGAESRAFAYWGRQYTKQLQLMLSTQGIEDILIVINKILPSATTALLFWFATTSIQQASAQGGQGGLSTGTFLAFNAAFGIFIAGATGLSSTVIDILQIIPLWQRSQPILQAEPEVSISKADPGRLTGRVIVEHAVFRYRSDGPLTLDDVSIKAEPGEFIALVGTSGSGKSTLFRLLLGFDIPESGSIYYDGQDLAGVDINALRRQLGVVMQNSRLMSASIFDNISCGALVTMEEAWEAARMAGFAEDVESMPMGMHTVVSEGGSNLSGGQRQRLLIARALVLKPRILLFDEATSALDNRTQAIVSASLDRLQVTRIVIAHRLSTIRNANRIYVLQGGRVVQEGSFDKLAKQEGLFAQLIARQQI